MLSELEAGLGYTFRDKSILENALTHSSYANENRERGLHDNERLEFLGDSILGFVVADYLYRNFPDKPEGELTRIPRRSCLRKKSGPRSGDDQTRQLSAARPRRGAWRRTQARFHRLRCPWNP